MKPVVISPKCKLPIIAAAICNSQQSVPVAIGICKIIGNYKQGRQKAGQGATYLGLHFAK